MLKKLVLVVSFICMIFHGPWALASAGQNIFVVTFDNDQWSYDVVVDHKNKVVSVGTLLGLLQMDVDDAALQTLRDEHALASKVGGVAYVHGGSMDQSKPHPAWLVVQLVVAVVALGVSVGSWIDSREAADQACQMNMASQTNDAQTAAYFAQCHLQVTTTSYPRGRRTCAMRPNFTAENPATCQGMQFRGCVADTSSCRYD